MKVGPADLAVLAAYTALVVGIGLLVGRGVRGHADYMVGGRNLPWWLLLASIVATETSTVTFLSIPGFAFERDLSWLQLALGYVAGRFVVARLLLPLYFRGELFTAYEVLQRRFGSATKQAASALFVVTRSLADGLRLFLTALVLQEVTGIGLPAAAAAIGLVTIGYTFFGGMRAVLWTDLVQLFVYLGGAVVALVILIGRLPGGLQGLLATAAAEGKLHVVDTSLDPSEPHTLLAGVLGGAFLTLGTHGADQLMVQRYLCADSARSAARAVIGSGFFVAVQFLLFLAIGVALSRFYALQPPAVPFDRADRVFAHFIVNELPTGMVGLLLGAVFAAAMSTLSSSLNSCATAAVNDFYQPLLRPGASSRELLAATRALTVVFGLVQVGVGVAGRGLEASVVAGVLAVAGFTTGIVLGVFLLGLAGHRVGERAALAGFLFGLAGMSLVAFLTPLAWPWYSLVGSALTFGCGWTASYLWPKAA